MEKPTDFVWCVSKLCPRHFDERFVKPIHIDVGVPPYWQNDTHRHIDRHMERTLPLQLKKTSAM